MAAQVSQRSPSLALDDSPLMIVPSTGPGGRKWRGEREGGKAVGGARASGESTARGSVRGNGFATPAEMGGGGGGGRQVG